MISIENVKIITSKQDKEFTKLFTAISNTSNVDRIRFIVMLYDLYMSLDVREIDIEQEKQKA